MSEVFTDYVASLGPDGEPPSRKSYEEVRNELRKVLLGELRSRGLLNAPPAYLGFLGGSWRDGDALDDLVQEAYAFNFVRRLRGLRNQLLIKPSIRGLVLRNIRNLLTDLQRKADPIGYRVFELLCSALLKAEERQELFVLERGSRKHGIHNDTVLGFSPEAALPAKPGDLDERVRGWNDELLPRLITARGHGVTKVVDRLSRRIVDLNHDGVEAFRFRDLVQPMRDDVRRRWGELLSGSLGETAIDRDGPEVPPVRVPIVRPRDVDGHSRFIELVDCVSQSIANVGEAQPREDLWDLWKALRSTVAGKEKMPSDVKLGERLGIPRRRLPSLRARIGEMVQRCRAQETGRHQEKYHSGELDNDPEDAGTEPNVRAFRRGGEGA